MFELSCDHTLSKFEDANACMTPPLKGRRGIGRGESLSPGLPMKVLGELELEETGVWEEPYQKSYKYPRFFVVESNGFAKELLSQS